MDNQKRLEREISVRELFWSFLFGWRKIVCLGIIFGILFTMLRYVQDTNNYNKSLNEEVSLEDELMKSELEEVENIKTLREEVKKYREYLNTSPVMQMDPYNEPMIEVQYKIQSDYVMNYTEDILQDYTQDVLSMYSRYLASGKFRKALITGANLDISSTQLKELIGVNRESNMMYVVVAYPEEEKLGEIAKVLRELLSEKEGEIQGIGSHKLVFMGEDQYEIVNDSLIEKKNTILGRIATFNVQINQLEASLTDDQKDVLEEDEKEEKEKLDLKQPNIQKKYVIVGIALGILLAGVWIVCGVLFTGKLQNPEEIRSMYGESLLGEINLGNRKKGVFSVIDDKLIAIKNRRRKKLSQEQQIAVACANAAIFCKRQKIVDIYMTGSEIEHLKPEFVQMLEQELTKQGIGVKTGNNMYYNAESMEKGGEIGNILFLEQVGESVYDEICNEIQLVKEQNMKIVGVIVLV